MRLSCDVLFPAHGVNLFIHAKTGDIARWKNFVGWCNPSWLGVGMRTSWPMFSLKHPQHTRQRPPFFWLAAEDTLAPVPAPTAAPVPAAAAPVPATAAPVPATAAPPPAPTEAPVPATPAAESAPGPTAEPNPSSGGRLSGLVPLLRTCQSFPP